MYRKSMRSALEEARAYSAVNEVKVSKGGRTLDISKKDVGVYQAKGWSLQEVGNFRGLMMDRLTKALKDKLSKEGGAAGFDDLKKTANKMGVVLTPANLKGMPGIKQHRDGDYILEEVVTEARYRVDGQLSYKGISGYDGFEVVVNANSEKDAEDKAYDALVKARDKRKIGPGGGRGLDDVEFEGIEKTNDRLEDPSTFRVSEFDPSKDLEEATPVPPRDLMLTYGKPGEKVKAYYTKFMQDLQNKAHELRKKGFVVDKMGLKQPMSKLRDRIPEQVEEETELVEFTLADYKELESDNQHDIAAKKLIDKFGTPQEKSTINDINRRHAKTGYISGTDFRLRTMIVNRYYSRLK